MSITADELRAHLKLKFVGDCKCGNCQLVPADLIVKAASEIDELYVLADKLQVFSATLQAQFEACQGQFLQVVDLNNKLLAKLAGR